MKIITTAIIKGGTGKTTVAAALLQAGVIAGKKMLAVDLDPQGNLSFALAADQTKPGAYELLHGTPAAELIQHSPQGMYIIPASPDLASEEGKQGSAKRLAEALEPIKKKYDYIIIDTPAAMGALTFNALQAATDVIIPLETDRDNLTGLYNITALIDKVQETNPKLKPLGVVFTQYDQRSTINRQLKDILTEKAGAAGIPLLKIIRPGIAIREARALQRSLFEYAPKSRPAAEYKELFEIIEQRR